MEQNPAHVMRLAMALRHRTATMDTLVSVDGTVTAS
jgi:hypothetical protein